MDALQEFQKKAPGNTAIAAGLDSLAKAQKSMDAIEVKVAGISPTGAITFQIANNGELPVYRLNMEYSNLDYKGDLLGKQLLLIGSDKLDPSAPDGFPPPLELPRFRGQVDL